VGARDWRAVREGETHAATETSKNKTRESLIVGIAASGALVAGAAIILITLLGTVSFKVWPTGDNAATTGGKLRHSDLTPGNSVDVGRGHGGQAGAGGGKNARGRGRDPGRQTQSRLRHGQGEGGPRQSGPLTQH
jgi:hypothetical protein